MSLSASEIVKECSDDKNRYRSASDIASKDK